MDDNDRIRVTNFGTNGTSRWEEPRAVDNGPDHEMTRETVERKKKRIEMSKPGLVSTDEETVEIIESEYHCSCGEQFDTGEQAHGHLQVEVSQR